MQIFNLTVLFSPSAQFTGSEMEWEVLIRGPQVLISIFSFSQKYCQFSLFLTDYWSGTVLCFSGECKNCKASLESIQLTEEEYAELKDKVMKKVIEGSDVFKKTTPEVCLQHYSHLLPE